MLADGALPGLTESTLGLSGAALKRHFVKT